jgi:hypothetical protein
MSLEAAEKLWKLVQRSLPRIENGNLVGKLSLDDFIIKAPNPTFKKAALPSKVNPLDYLRPTLIIWEPCIFWNHACTRLPCPQCSLNEENERKKLSTDTISNGWSPLRRVSDISDTVFIVSKKYMCKICNTTFLSNDIDVLKLLPKFISMQYPCELTARRGLSNDLFDVIEELAVEVSMRKIQSVLRSLYAKKFTRNHLLFLLVLQYISEADSIHKHLRDWSIPPIPFPTAFLNPPSRQYITQRYLAKADKRRQFIDNQMGSINGKSLLFDHTFKIAKYLKQYAHSDRLFEAVGTVMNEYGQVVSQVFTPTTGNSCILYMLRNVQKRMDTIDCIYVDNCCKIRGFLTDIFGPSTKVILDVYHLMDRILRTLSKFYRYYAAFAKELSNCLLKANEEDVTAAKRLLFERSQAHPNRRIAGKKLSEINPNDPPRNFLKRNCRYRTRDVEDIKIHLQNLIKKYSNIHPEPLPQRTIAMIKKQYENHIKKQCIVDPYEINEMYIERVGDIYRYHCKRGTSIMENYHRGIRAILSGTSAGTTLVDTLLREYNYRHNQRAAWRNSCTIKTIHYDLELLQQINEIHQEIFPDSEIPYKISVTLEATKETFGVSGATEAMAQLLGIDTRGFLTKIAKDKEDDENEENIDIEDEQDEEYYYLSDVIPVFVTVTVIQVKQKQMIDRTWSKPLLNESFNEFLVLLVMMLLL